MTFSVAFWVLILVSVVFGLWQGFRPNTVAGWGNSILTIVLIILLGLKVFGPMFHG